MYDECILGTNIVCKIKYLPRLTASYYRIEVMPSRRFYFAFSRALRRASFLAEEPQKIAIDHFEFLLEKTRLY